MLIPDANVLLNAFNRRAEEHELARQWLLASLRGREPVGFAWTALLAFIRVSTHPQVFREPLETHQAVALVRIWLSARPAILAEPTYRHLALLGGLLARARTGGNLVNDAHLAALALEHDATIVSFDRDFQRFEGVRSRLPGQ